MVFFGPPWSHSSYVQAQPPTVGLDVWCLVGPFVNFHISCMRTARLARLRWSPNVISTIISWAGSNVRYLRLRSRRIPIACQTLSKHTHSWCGLKCKNIWNGSGKRTRDTWIFYFVFSFQYRDQASTFARSREKCWKPRSNTEGFNSSSGTGHIIMN